MATTETDRYNAALFVSYLEEAVSKNADDLEEAVGEALFRFSPDATAAQKAAYVEDITDTITDDEGSLRSNWRDLIIEEHAA